jgi:hypothetical protein
MDMATGGAAGEHPATTVHASRDAAANANAFVIARHADPLVRAAELVDRGTDAR